MRNHEVAALLERIARLLEVKGENQFRVGAYREAARRIESLPQDVADLHAEGRLQEIPGVGPSIAAKIDEYLRTGRLLYLEDLEKEIDPAVYELLAVPGLGAKRAQLIHHALGVRTVADLEQAARSHQLSKLPGFGARSEEKILREIERLPQRTRRLPLGVALPAAEEVVRLLSRQPAVRRIDAGGSIRRMEETIGDIDVLVASDRPLEVMDAFTSLPNVREVLARGPTRSSILTAANLQIDVRVIKPEEYGAALQYFTGSKPHNIALRDVAMAREMKLNEYGVFELSTGRRLGGETEEEVYHILGLEWIPPELRTNRGEIEAAARGELPHLVEQSDVLGDLHIHTDWSDGAESLERMAEAARARGYRYVAITDHSQGLGIAHGLRPGRLREQRQAIDGLNRRLAPFRILQGIECDVRADGSLDYPDEVLRQFDLVTASVHSGFGQTRDRMTARVLRALQNPYVDVLNHPTGRLVEQRPGYEIDLEAVLRAAAETGTALEINGQPDRLDLNDVWTRRAREAGAMLAINTDAHAVSQLGFMRYGVAVARRGWLEKRNVLNALPADQLRRRLRRFRHAA